MTRNTILAIIGGTVAVAAIGVAVAAAVVPPTPGSAAWFRQFSAASPIQPAYSVPIELRRAHADSCTGFNLELEDAAGIQRRLDRTAEADRLLAMRRDCTAAGSTTARSAAR